MVDLLQFRQRLAFYFLVSIQQFQAANHTQEIKLCLGPGKIKQLLVFVGTILPRRKQQGKTHHTLQGSTILPHSKAQESS